MKKLLLIIALLIPMVGYCGFIDWIQGYPEVKEKLVQRLTEKYNGDKFEVLDLEYSNNLKGYNFKAKDISKDIVGEGSYFPKSNVIWANEFKQKMLEKNLDNMLKPYISQVSNNYLFAGSLNSLSISGLSAKEDMKLTNQALSYRYTEGVDARKLIAKHHDLLNFAFVLKVQSKQDPESIYKVIKMVYEINKYLQSLNLGEYVFTLETFDVPKDFDIKDWYKVKFKARSSSVNPDKDLYKYAWGYLKIMSCPHSSKWGKACETQTELHRDGNGNTIKDKNGNYKQFLIQKKADHIHSIQDIAKYFEIYNQYGSPKIDTRAIKLNKEMKKMGSEIRYPEEYWTAFYRKKTPLNKTKYYPAVEKLILENKK